MLQSLVLVLILIIMGILIINPKIITLMLFNESSKDPREDERRDIIDEAKKMEEALKTSRVLSSQLSKDIESIKSTIERVQTKIEESITEDNDDEAKRLIKSISNYEDKLKKLEKQYDIARHQSEMITEELSRMRDRVKNLERQQLMSNIQSNVDIKLKGKEDIETQLLEAAKEADVDKKLEDYKLSIRKKNDIG